MFIDFLLEVFQKNPSHPAVVWNRRRFTYADIQQRIEQWAETLVERSVPAGAVVGVDGDFSPNAIGVFLALIAHGCIIVPQSNMSAKGRERKDEIAQVEYYFRVDAEDNVTFEICGRRADHALYTTIRNAKHAGLVLFSSGTSGDPKAAVHDFLPLLEKFKKPRKAFSTLNFLLFDHWGGLNTLLHTLANGGTTVTVRDRSPEHVCKLIEDYQVALLPATPTFLNLLLISGAYKQFDLSSLQIISYGAEPMPESTLKRLNEVFPNVLLQQTYGLIEVGVLRSKSKENGSLWVKVGGEGYETRVVDGLLEIKTASTILGYLNAPSPITADGWFMTGDAVEVDGEYMRILGRKSELINVGGEKVYPAEVESVIQTMQNVSEVTVYGEKNPLMGSIVCAKVKLIEPQPNAEFISELKQYCAARMERFKVPVKVAVVEHKHYGDRFKKARSSVATSGGEGSV
jgi:acyl-CoA synthetase (AMP-forming)/AMP-acid ligase II